MVSSLLIEFYTHELALYLLFHRKKCRLHRRVFFPPNEIILHATELKSFIYIIIIITINYIII